MKKARNTYNILVQNCAGKRPFEEPRRTLEHNIKTDLVVNRKIVDWGPLTEGQRPEL
jgi:hypothetical protein